MFRLLEPEAFEVAFRRFMAAFGKTNQLNLTGVVAVDGKALRGAFERGSRCEPLHMVNVFAVEARMSLAQQKAPGRNETAGALEVLALLSLEGCIVTADALHCHRTMAKTVLDRGGDYVLAIKANRGPLLVPRGFVAESACYEGDKAIVLVRACGSVGLCRSCGTVLRRVHSRYRRRVTGLPLSGRIVQLLVIARRFRCDAVLCGGQIFTERFAEGVLAPSARRTARLAPIFITSARRLMVDRRQALQNG